MRLLHVLGLVIACRMNEYVHSQAASRPHTLPTLAGAGKVVLVRSTMNSAIDELPPLWVEGCCYVGIDQ